MLRFLKIVALTFFTVTAAKITHFYRDASTEFVLVECKKPADETYYYYLAFHGSSVQVGDPRNLMRNTPKQIDINALGMRDLLYCLDPLSSYHKQEVQTPIVSI
jgi:hypothetical protein